MHITVINILTFIISIAIIIVIIIIIITISIIIASAVIYIMVVKNIIFTFQKQSSGGVPKYILL